MSPIGAGQKAATLAALRDAGFRVPEFVVSPADLRDAFERLGPPLAVRSSASVEDGSESSFAGQFRSFLNLNTLEEVETAVRLCRESARSSEVIAYCRRNGFDSESVSVNVIVQRMVQPELAGVVFTINPVSGDDAIVIEAVEGLADELLSGRKAPLPREHPLVMKYAPQIEQTARGIQRHLGQPQDIEFAIEGGTLYILQSRPVTRINFDVGVGEWTNADFRDGGVSSSVCTPLMWSLYDFVWERTLKDTLRELHLFDGDFEAGRMFFGRPYWNLGAVKRCVAKLHGFVERDFDADLDVSISYAGDGRCTPITVSGILRAVPILWALSRFFRRQRRFDEHFLASGFAGILRQYDATPAGSPSAFRELIERDFFATESNYFRTIFATSLAKLDFASAFPDVDHRLLVSALAPLRHMEPVRAVQALINRDDKSLDEIVAKYRHHCRLGLDVRFPRWDEDRAFVQNMLRNLPSSGGADPRPAYLAARAEALSRLPRWKRATFRRKLDRLRAFVWLREEMRDLSNQMYHVIRRHVLEISRRKGFSDEVFFMTFQEIVAGDTSRVEQNRETYESYRTFRAPNEIRGGHLAGSGGVETLPGDGRPAHSAMRGIGASPGTVTEIAHIAHTVQQALEMSPGHVLVCPFTDPGWTPVLDRASAVVTETGGLLSHAAVICREYGIPAVLGVAGATSRIRRGSQIVVNGTDGRVERIESQ
ncbi:MAG: PEP/pyruvate-binding domain-containing protein [Planctomycetaceae bacterium]